MHSFLETWKSEYKRAGSKVPAHWQEEYLTSSGTIDWHYVGLTLNTRISASRGNDALNTACGRIKFDIDVNDNELSFEEFSSIYEFGRYRNVRGWIAEAYTKTGKLLTRSTLFDYLDKLRPQYTKIEVIDN